MDHKSQGDPEKHTLLLDRERELLDGISDGGSSTSTLLDNMVSEGKHSELDDIEAPHTAAAATVAPKVLIKSNRTLLTIWMVVNTVATIGIVSDRSSSDKCIGAEPFIGRIPNISFFYAGVCKQGHLQRPFIPTMSMRFCSLPFLRHRSYPLRPFSAVFRPLRAKAPPRTNNASSRHRHVPQHCPNECLSRHLDHHILPNCPNSTYSCDCSSKLHVLPQDNTP